jgi:plasmid stability protein
MSSLVIPDIDDSMIERLSDRAAANGRTTKSEAKAILQEALGSPPASGWKKTNAIRESLAATSQRFSESADLIREDRDR